MVGDVEVGEAADHAEDVLADGVCEVPGKSWLVNFYHGSKKHPSFLGRCLVPLTEPPPEHLFALLEAHGHHQQGDLNDVLPEEARLAGPCQRTEVAKILQEDDNKLDEKFLENGLKFG